MAPTRVRVAGSLALALIAALFLTVNLIAQVGLSGMRLDLTENKLYTLSDGTLAILDKLDEPVTLRLYHSATLSNQFPAIKTFAGRVTELLDAFRRAGHGNVRIEIIDPIPFTTAEDEAVAAGIRGNDTPSGEAFYFGLVGTGPIGGREVMPVIAPDRESFLEYDLAKMIVSLTAERKPVLGVISALPLDVGFGGAMAAMRGQSQPFTVYAQLSELYDVRMMAPDFVEIGAHIDMLLIAHPQKLNPQQLYAIDQFVLAGGRAVVLVDPNAEVMAQTAQQGAPPPQLASDLDPLLAAWGVKVDPDTVIGDARMATKVTVAGSRRPLDYLVWLRADKTNFNADDIVTANLSQVLLATAGSIATLPDATTTVTPLITTSTEAGTFNPIAVRVTRNPEDLTRMFKPEGRRFTLAARITGPAPSAFAGGPPRVDSNQAPNPTPEGQEPAFGARERSPLTQSVAPINVVLIADADVLDDRLWVQTAGQGAERSVVPTADNGNFIVNAVENLAGSADLIAVRGRAPAARPFTRVEGLKEAAERKFMARSEELQAKLDATQARIIELRRNGGSGGTAGAIVSAETERALADARAEVAATRRELREVQRNLNVDIERLESRLRFVNIGLVPLLVAIIAVILSFARLRRRRARQ
ncbi:GldG family protein [Zavarzinia compransoris]|uniref:GldG family protein n=1 Tax=Zavarzinia marina TaxID=2911065 RepID=UPI001F3327EC|nr:GldG family protein [Zavarzinia marina]MCF4165781.1 GldG family protein [Zavarzinia marina]